MSQSPTPISWMSPITPADYAYLSNPSPTIFTRSPYEELLEGSVKIGKPKRTSHIFGVIGGHRKKSAMPPVSSRDLVYDEDHCCWVHVTAVSPLPSVEIEYWRRTSSFDPFGQDDDASSEYSSSSASESSLDIKLAEERPVDEEKSAEQKLLPTPCTVSESRLRLDEPSSSAPRGQERLHIIAPRPINAQLANAATKFHEHLLSMLDDPYDDAVADGVASNAEDTPCADEPSPRRATALTPPSAPRIPFVSLPTVNHPVLPSIHNCKAVARAVVPLLFCNAQHLATHRAFSSATECTCWSLNPDLKKNKHIWAPNWRWLA